jgi:D-lactate dehydrogenase
MKIAFFEIEGWEEKILSAAFKAEDGFELTISKEKIEPFSVPADKSFEILSVFVDSRLTKEVIGMFPNLKLIVTRSTGYDHIDLAACSEKGIAVAYVPGYGDNTVAEFAFGLLLNLTRKIYLGIDRIKEYGSFSLDGLRGIDLKGKTIGIIGTGRIGKEMIKIANGFGMKAIAYDVFPAKDLEEQLNFRYQTLEEVLSNSDVVSVHTPYMKETHHLLNTSNIPLMKKGSYLINTARGGIVETAAIVAGLENGTLAGVGLDVLEEEGETKDELEFLSKARPNEEELRTIIENHVLMKMPNVLITPHNAFNSQEALERILDTTLGNVRGFIEGKKINLVPQK